MARPVACVAITLMMLHAASLQGAPLQELQAALNRAIVGPALPAAEVQHFCEARVPRLSSFTSARDWDAEASRLRASVLDRVERAGSFMSDAVARPMRQLSGLIASVRAAVETLRGPDAVPTRVPHYTDSDHRPGPRATGTTTPFRP